MSDQPTQDGPSLPSELELPVLAIRNTVIFPVLAFPINVGREKSLLAVDEALENDKLLAIWLNVKPRTRTRIPKTFTPPARW